MKRKIIFVTALVVGSLVWVSVADADIISWNLFATCDTDSDKVQLRVSGSQNTAATSTVYGCNEMGGAPVTAAQDVKWTGGCVSCSCWPNGVDVACGESCSSGYQKCLYEQTALLELPCDNVGSSYLCLEESCAMKGAQGLDNCITAQSLEPSSPVAPSSPGSPSPPEPAGGCTISAHRANLTFLFVIVGAFFAAMIIVRREQRV
jgi:hypothetical protein